MFLLLPVHVSALIAFQIGIPKEYLQNTLTTTFSPAVLNKAEDHA